MVGDGVGGKERIDERRVGANVSLRIKEFSFPVILVIYILQVQVDSF